MKKFSGQTLALRARVIPGAKALFGAAYSLGSWFFLRLVRASQRKFAERVVIATYLRRGGGRSEIVPAASDLDFFLVLSSLTAHQEMTFLKQFWPGYQRLKKVFPFLGEVLMGDEFELAQWREGNSVRAFEADFSWQLLEGQDVLAKSESGERPDPRDLFGEAVRYYWEILQPVLKLRLDDFSQSTPTHGPGAVKLRHAAKAALDLFRLHYSSTLPTSELPALWRASRLELTRLLPAHYGDTKALAPLLLLEGPLYRDDPFLLFSGILHRAGECIHDLASRLRNENEATRTLAAATTPLSDPHSLSVRELFAERLLFRHETVLSRAVLSENTAQMYFLFSQAPTLTEFRDLLADLRDVTFSFERFSVAMPLSERAFAELERTSLFDSPFHSLQGHRELRWLGEEGFECRPYGQTEMSLPESVLKKAFSELSFSLRLKPDEFSDFLERIVSLVLSLRLAGEKNGVSTGFRKTFDLFGEKFPLRAELVKNSLAPYLPASGRNEDELWDGVLGALDGNRQPRAALLKSQLEQLRRQNQSLHLSRNLPSDVWINLTPFLRMELNASKEAYFSSKAPLKL